MQKFYRLFLVFFLVINYSTTFSQKKIEKIITGTFSTLLIRGEMLTPQLRNKYQQIAKNTALDSAFGTIVSSEASTFMVDKTKGGKIAFSSSDFREYSFQFLNGIWLNDIEIKDTTKLVNNDLWYYCHVKGLAREVKHPRNNFKVKTLNTPNPISTKTDYTDNEDFYMYFKSAENGYLYAFLDDLDTTQRFLPYNGMTEEFKVEADKEYILFSPKHDYLNNPKIVDEFALFARQQVDINILYVVFSKHILKRPLVKKIPHNADIMLSGYFRNWLQEQRIYDEKGEIQVEIIGLTISKE